MFLLQFTLKLRYNFSIVSCESGGPQVFVRVKCGLYHNHYGHYPQPTRIKERCFIWDGENLALSAITSGSGLFWVSIVGRGRVEYYCLCLRVPPLAPLYIPRVLLALYCGLRVISSEYRRRKKGMEGFSSHIASIGQKQKQDHHPHSLTHSLTSFLSSPRFPIGEKSKREN